MSKVKLYKYQEEAFNNTMEIYKRSNRACVIMATGTGKSYVMMRLLEEFDKEEGRAYILTPNNPTKEQTVEKMIEYGLNNAEFGLYQTINAMTDEEIARIDCDLIIADELHRTGATQWGKKFEHLINTHPNAKVFGVTATPIRSDGRDMAEEYFEGNKACEISLSDAIVREILPMPLYVSGLYTFDEEFSNMKKKIDDSRNSVEEKLELMETLKVAKQQLEKSNGVPEIIKKYITNYNGKYIVFCKNKTHMKKMKGTVKKWFKQADYNGKIFSYEYYSEDKDANENFNNFQNNNQEGLKLLFVIDMLNEGLHLKDINGCILLRTTGSHIVYYQQIGRVIDAGSEEQRIILDLVSNFNSLKSFNLKKELKESVKKRRNGKFSECPKEFELDKFDVVDLVKECVDVFNNIDNMIIGDSWTKEEDDIIRDKYPKLGIEMCLFLPNRSKRAIYHRAIRLKVKKDDKKQIEEWNESEIEKLKTLYPKYSTKCFEQFDNKTIQMLKDKVKELGLMSNLYWDSNEIDILKDKYPSMGSKCSVYFENKNEAQTKQKAHELGIKYERFNKWTEEEINILETYYPIIGSKCVKYLPNRTERDVRNRAFRLNLITRKPHKSKYKYVHWDKKKERWKVTFSVGKEKFYFGSYISEDEAGRVAMEKAKEYGKI